MFFFGTQCIYTVFGYFSENMFSDVSFCELLVMLGSCFILYHWLVTSREGCFTCCLEDDLLCVSECLVNNSI